MYSNKLICDIIRYIDSNINTKISIEDLEIKFFYNRYYLMKLFKKELKLTITNYINDLRIYNSLIQIRDTNYSLLNIAFKNGFYSIEYFSEMFKKVVGVNPQVAKNYFKKRNDVSLEQINTINESLLYLYNIKKHKDEYLSHEKPSIAPIKKLSIFR